MGKEGQAAGRSTQAAVMGWAGLAGVGSRLAVQLWSCPALRRKGMSNQGGEEGTVEGKRPRFTKEENRGKYLASHTLNCQLR